jgi:transposase
MAQSVIVGVDTHKDAHVAIAKDEMGRHLGELVIPASPSGYRELLCWAKGYGEVASFGVEGTGSYGAGLSRHLASVGQRVIEVNRPNRQTRRRNGKSDPADAEAAARAVLSGEAATRPKAADDVVEMIRVLRIARRTAIKARTQAINAMQAILITYPEDLRQSLKGLSATRLVRTCARFRVSEASDPLGATRMALRFLARRHEALEAECSSLQAELERLTTRAAAELKELYGVGTDTAGALLVAAGDNPERLRSEAAFSALCGVSPMEASSGKTMRHRLNRGGNREANQALWRIVMVRISRKHQPTMDYVARRMAEGKTKREIIRCLKRYVAREVYAVLVAGKSDASAVA